MAISCGLVFGMGYGFEYLQFMRFQLELNGQVNTTEEMWPSIWKKTSFLYAVSYLLSLLISILFPFGFEYSAYGHDF